MAVNTTKQSYYCFAQGKGGDIIALTAHIRGQTQRDAAAWIAEQTGTAPEHRAPTAVKPRQASQKGREGFDAEAYAQRLDPANSALEALGISPDTLRAFKAGYSGSGRYAGAPCTGSRSTIASQRMTTIARARSPLPDISGFGVLESLQAGFV